MSTLDLIDLMIGSVFIGIGFRAGWTFVDFMDFILRVLVRFYELVKRDRGSR